MSDAPETIVLQPCFAEGWALPDRVKYETSIAIQYTRTDISQARIAGLEATMKKDAKIYYDAKAIIDAHQVIYREAREEQRARIAQLEAALTEIACFEPANPFEDMECQAMARADLKAKP
jgi:hypothetical protein